MKNTILILLLGIALGISSTSLINYVANHSRNTWDHTITIDNSQILQNIKSKINPSKYDKFGQIYQILNREYYRGTGSNHTGKNIRLDEDLMLESALHGFVDGVGDEHTTYFDAQESSWLNQVLAGDQEFEGIGAIVSRKVDGIQIMEVLKSSPAQLAGIRPRDFIIKINNQSTDHMTTKEAVTLIRWPKGSTVDITIFRPSDETAAEQQWIHERGNPWKGASIKTITVTRDRIDVPSVSRNLIPLSGDQGNIWYISFSIFGEDTYLKFRDAIAALQNEQIKWYIIDVRGNGGGFLPTAIDIASHFVPKGNIIATTRYSTFPSQIYKSDWREWIDRLAKVVVLMDEYSASASEVLALTFKQTIDATLIGSATFGKGSIQTLYNFNDGSKIKYTIGRRYAPDNTNVDHQWIAPDISVDFDIKAYQASWVDNQLQTAITYIKNIK
jgi:carboxyl-terminal processing protease